MEHDQNTLTHIMKSQRENIRECKYCRSWEVTLSGMYALKAGKQTAQKGRLVHEI